jgi:ectoine hydroxylase-related dioxygenase (phytanoyl-CoA dioxygenase family)
MITDAQRKFWDDNGYLIVEGVLSEARLAEVRQAIEARFVLEGDRAGSEGSDNPGVRRLCNLFAKGRPFEELGTEPIALEMARLTIGDDIRWQAMNFHDPLPRDLRTHQSIHADRSFFADCSGYLNVVWAIDAMTEENGATRLVPGSHKRSWPIDLADPKAPVEGEIYAECGAGAAVFVHGDCWHGGRINRTDAPRRVIHMGFACPATPPQYEIAGAITAETRRRLGAHAALIPGTLDRYGLSDDPTKGRSIDTILVERKGQY